MVARQFDVYLVNLDPTVGSEIRKTRPAVVISPHVMNKHLATVIVAPFTHSVKGYPSRVPSQFKGETGEIVLDQIRALDKVRLVRKVGRIDAETGEGLKRILQTMFS